MNRSPLWTVLAPHAVLVFAAATILASGIAGVAGADPADRKSVDPEAIEARIREVWDERGPAAATLEILAVPTLPHGPGEIRIDVALPEEGLDRAGPRAIPVSVAVDGRTVARGLANILVTVEREVWIAARDLEREENPGEDAFLRETRTYDREALRLFRLEEGRKYKMVRDVPAGALVTTTDVQALPLVEAGATIHLVAKSGSASVSVPGRARTGGDVGEIILVHNPLTGQIVKARLLDENSALVEPKPGSTPASSGPQLSVGARSTKNDPPKEAEPPKEEDR